MTCECGCGGKPSGNNRFINGHNRHIQSILSRGEINYGVVEDERVAFIPLGGGGVFIVDEEKAQIFQDINCSLKDGYAIASINCTNIKVHKLITDYGDMEHEHKNRNKLDNRISNLRPATREQNMSNVGPKIGHPTGYKGVTKLPNGKFRSRIRASGKQHNLGVHTCAEKAAKAYDEKAVEIFGEFAYLNFPEEWFREGVK